MHPFEDEGDQRNDRQDQPTPCADMTLTYQEAADRTGKGLSTIFRWAAKGYIRRVLTPDGWKVSMSDVDAMIGKKWTRKARQSGT